MENGVERIVLRSPIRPFHFLAIDFPANLGPNYRGREKECVEMNGYDGGRVGQRGDEESGVVG